MKTLWRVKRMSPKNMTMLDQPGRQDVNVDTVYNLTFQNELK